MATKPLHKRLWIRLTGTLVLIFVTAALVWFGIALHESQVDGKRSPYLQMAGPDRVTLRWGSVKAERGEVFYGTQADKLMEHQQETAAEENHRVILRGLQPDTRYYYRIRQAGSWLMPQAEWFHTSPKIGSSQPLRIWVIGDPGETGRIHFQVSEHAQQWFIAHARPNLPLLDFILTTGDNAYPNATNAQYSSGFFKPFGNFFKNITVWPVFGNHDARRWAFYRIFDRPLNGELGGVPSHDKAYFSFDYGRTHIVMLDSEHGDLSPDSPMLAWLKQDLSQTRQDWIIVDFHHPPYTFGTHNSDKASDSRGRMIRVRENLVPILERAGVDLVLSGHSHDYERSALIDCHYGFSGSFADWMIKDKGKKDSSGVMQYSKAHRGQSPYDGTMYLVVGSSGQGNKVAQLHPAIVTESGEPGSLVLDINGQTLQGRYLNMTGELRDAFTITKGVDQNAPPSLGCRK